MDGTAVRSFDLIGCPPSALGADHRQPDDIKSPQRESCSVAERTQKNAKSEGCRYAISSDLRTGMWTEISLVAFTYSIKLDSEVSPVAYDRRKLVGMIN